ncbi:uncharacterized protein RCO7_10054 [Rhynchosporium graminicola]|uniref:Uncharacterized protein n=1 Tax=Rhynchosporium graminicola TaxID=2792576 RepID=A0A1E1L1E7_9HELO|nr:uncharacterized protein RCO7_10054 [Rhynchosporium commune]
MSSKGEFEVVISKKSKQFARESAAFRFLDLDREIRNLIYSHCFVRPIGIAPGQNMENESDPAPVDGQVERMLVTWTSIPTRKQQDLLSQGGRYFTDTQVDAGNEIYSKIEHRTNKRHDGTFEIINSQSQNVSGLAGISLLATSQQVYNEACEILYGKNTFVINTAFVHGLSTFDLDSYLYSGYPNNNGHTASMTDNYRRVHKLLERGRHSDFAIHDPLLIFLRKIGPHCASLLRSLKINGLFKSQAALVRRYSLYASMNHFDRKLPFAKILPVYTHVLREICTNLRSLTLSQSMGGEHRISQLWKWVDEDDRSDGERFSKAVGVVVKGLPSLEHLQLGDYSCPWEDVEEVEVSEEHTADVSDENIETESNDPWGVAVRRSAVVRERNIKRVFGGGSKNDGGANMDRHLGRDRVFTLQTAVHQGGGKPDIEESIQARFQQLDDVLGFTKVDRHKRPRNLPLATNNTS